MEDDVLGLQIEMNDSLGALVEILEAAEDLRHDQLGFLLRYLPILLEVEVQVWPRAQLKDRAEAVVVNFNRVKLADHTTMAQVFVDLVLTNRMLDVVVLDLLRPTVVEVVHLAGNFTTRLQVIRLVHFRVATLAQHAHDKVAILEDSKVIATVVDAAVLGSFLVSHALELLQVHHFLFF